MNGCLIQEINAVLDQAEKTPSCRFIILKGQEGFFCTGMDFKEITQEANETAHALDTVFTASYMALLK